MKCIFYNFWTYLPLNPNLILGFCSADITPNSGHHSCIFFSIFARDLLQLDLVCEFLVHFKWFAFFFPFFLVEIIWVCTVYILSYIFIYKCFLPFLKCSGMGWPFCLRNISGGMYTLLYFIPSNLKLDNSPLAHVLAVPDLCHHQMKDGVRRS